MSRWVDCCLEMMPRCIKMDVVEVLTGSGLRGNYILAFNTFDCANFH